MNWEQLISFRRFGHDLNHSLAREKVDARNEFERDIDRIIFSFPFRRLQDKTQVFPIPKSDFVHSRLTHSLEVAAVGRSLGKLAGRFILDFENGIKDYDTKLDFRPGHFGNILAASCLAHDIGNPPIGHSGEDAFRKFFLSKTGKLQSKFGLSDKEISDLTGFEGNANGFRILTNDHPSGTKGGMRMTYSTLASFAKYPKESGEINLNSIGKATPDRASQKSNKFGFFQREADLFTNVAEFNGLISLSSDQKSWCRHPLAFLVEAADTICYSCIDVEDGYHLRYISFEEVEEILLPLADSSINQEDPCNSSEEYLRIKDRSEKVGYLRSRAINNLIYLSLEVFKSNYESIMRGVFDSELTDKIKVSKEFSDLKRLNKEKFYNTAKGVQIEIAGYTILGGLLAQFLEALENPSQRWSEKVLGLLPTHLKPEGNNNYLNILKVCDFVAGMTDSYSIDLYRKFDGNKFPEID